MGEFGGVGVVGLGHEEGTVVVIAAAADLPFPVCHGDHMGHVDAETVHAHVLPVGEDGVHFLPGIRGVMEFGVFVGERMELVKRRA